MNTQEWLDDIEDELRIAGVKVTWDRFTLLQWASIELNRLSGAYESDCFLVHLDPVVSTVSGTRFYDLPENFGLNFSRNAGDYGDKYCCKIDDGSSELVIEYVAAAQFYSMNLRAENKGKPSKYTIISASNGRKQIGLSPIPDAAYEIDGLYKPTNWNLQTMDSLPPLPGNSAVLKYAVLHRMGDKWDQDLAMEQARLMMEFSKSSSGRLTPNLGASVNNYQRINRW